jgi:hypothetical protein
MAKVLVATTNIKHDGETFEPGTEFSAEDAKRFSKDQLQALYDSGALVVEDKKDETPETAEAVVEDDQAPADEDDAE